MDDAFALEKEVGALSVSDRLLSFPPVDWEPFTVPRELIRKGAPSAVKIRRRSSQVKRLSSSSSFPSSSNNGRDGGKEEEEEEEEDDTARDIPLVGVIPPDDDDDDDNEVLPAVPIARLFPIPPLGIAPVCGNGNVCPFPLSA